MNTVIKLKDFVKASRSLISQGSLDINEGFRFSDSNLMTLKKRLATLGSPLGSKHPATIGVQTSQDRVFILTNEEYESFNWNEVEQSLFYDCLTGRDVTHGEILAYKKFLFIPSGWTNQNRGIQSAESYFESTLPNINSYFLSKGAELYDKLVNRTSAGNYWWELNLGSIRGQLLEEDTVVFARISTEPKFVLAPAGTVLINSMSRLLGCTDVGLIPFMGCDLVYKLFKSMYADVKIANVIYSSAGALGSLVVPPTAYDNQTLQDFYTSGEYLTNPEKVSEYVKTLYQLTDEEYQYVMNLE